MSRVLAVDDDPLILGAVTRALETAGHQVIATSDQEQAMGLVLDRQIDAVVLDVIMPGRSGLDLLAEIRSDPRTADIPVLMLSCLAGGEDRIRGLRGGADDYLPKPFEAEELLLRLEHLLGMGWLRSAKLQGSLEHFTVQEILQQLSQGEKTGILHITSEQGFAAIDLFEGAVALASFGRLDGLEAVIAATELSTGSFRFEPIRLFESPETCLSIPQVLIHAAWIKDELARREPIAPNAHLSVARVMEAASVPAAANLPVEPVLRKVARHPGMTFASLLEEEIAAPQRVRLAVAVLRETGGLTVNLGAQAQGDADALVPPNDPLAEAVEGLLRVVVLRGHAPSLAHLLVVPSAAVARSGAMKPLVTSCGEDGERRADAVCNGLRMGQGSSLPLRGPSGTLLLHIQPVAHTTSRTRAQALLPSCVGAVAWAHSTADVAAIDWLINGVEQRWPQQAGVLVADAGLDAGIITEVESREGWQVMLSSPTSWTDVLERLAAAQWEDLRAVGSATS